MTAEVGRIPEIACVPFAIPAGEREAHFALARELFGRRAQEHKDLTDGYAIRFAHDAFESVARFVSNERRCCPFMRFELDIEAGAGPLWLRITGPEGTRDVLQAELDFARSCGCE